MARGLRQGARVIAPHGKKGKDLPTATIGCRPNTELCDADHRRTGRFHAIPLRSDDVDVYSSHQQRLQIGVAKILIA